MTSTIRVLYAEDNPQDVDQTRSHFAEYAPEFEFEIAETGRACLDRLKQAEFDLLLLDNRLPDMDGVEVLTELIHSRVQTPIAMITGVGDEDLVAKALRLGAINYVPKQGAYLDTLPELLHGVMAEHRRRMNLGLFVALPRRILYVEHHPMDIELTLQHFAEAAPHFLVDVVHSCNEALSQLEQQPAYDLVLVDLRMPDQTGLEFIRRAKRCHFPLPPFIVLSGKGDEATAIATLRLGAADYITKREGYLNQLVYTIEHAIAFDKLNRLEEELRVEIDERKRAEELQRHAAEAAQAACLAKSEFIANMSHEFRTPLNAIIGFTEGLLEHTAYHPLDEYQRDRLTKVLESSDHLLTLVNGVLDLAGIDSGKVEVRPAPFEVAECARELDATAKSLLRDSPGVRFTLDIEENLPLIVSDRDMLWQMLSNLISNAVHATVQGSVTLRVRYVPKTHTILLSVEDTGVGIREEDRERIFERFFQAKNMPYRSVRGTGLGLSICKSYAELLGGSLSVRSVVGQGSTFTLTLPLVYVEEQKEEPSLARC
jgi:signal transduction histidine kinase